MSLMTLYEACVLWVSRGPVHACIETAWTVGWVSLSI